jgi:hypothetical protein
VPAASPCAGVGGGGGGAGKKRASVGEIKTDDQGISTGKAFTLRASFSAGLCIKTEQQGMRDDTYRESDRKMHAPMESERETE